MKITKTVEEEIDVDKFISNHNIDQLTITRNKERFLAQFVRKIIYYGFPSNVIGGAHGHTIDEAVSKAMDDARAGKF